VASYLEARDKRHIWYQIDSGDADPATFVHYMRTAAAPFAKKGAAASRCFPPEPQQDLARSRAVSFAICVSVLPASVRAVLAKETAREPCEVLLRLGRNNDCAAPFFANGAAAVRM